MGGVAFSNIARPHTLVASSLRPHTLVASSLRPHAVVGGVAFSNIAPSTRSTILITCIYLCMYAKRERERERESMSGRRGILKYRKASYTSSL